MGGNKIVGPGIHVDVTSDITPAPTVGFWTLSLFGMSGGVVTSVNLREQKQTASFPTYQFHLAIPEQDKLVGTPIAPLTEDQGIHAFADLQSPAGATIDHGERADLTWTNLTAPFQAYEIGKLQTSGGGQGGLTDEQAQQLANTTNSAWLSELLDDLTLVELTNGPQGGNVGASLPAALFGCIVRIETVPDGDLPGTADGDYWFQSLAVVRVYRGSDLWIRVPIHTSTKLVSFWGDNLLIGVGAITVTEWLLNLHLSVDFREGVTGRVFLMRVP